jgi:DnaJ-class molecular chaperone
MTVTPPLNYCPHGYAETEHCRTCEIMGTCTPCNRHRCPECGGNGQISQLNENDYTIWIPCPKCDGTGNPQPSAGPTGPDTSTCARSL